MIDVLKSFDPEIYKAINHEFLRQCDNIELIASENIVSKAVLIAQGSILTNKYAEGYPGKRYYNGCEFVDEVENLAIDRAKSIFGAKYVNVQPHSGTNANHSVFFAFLKPGDKIMGLDISCGGHLTHGAKVSESGSWFESIPYHVDASGIIDYQKLREDAKKHHPKLIIAGASAYSRVIDWSIFREICDEVGAIFMADIAHYAGLIVAGSYPSPIGIADVVTSTTHKTLRGPRGGIILWNDEKYTKNINFATFPATQGGPLMHIIAAKAVCFKEASTEEFRKYGHDVVKNAKTFANKMIDNGLNIVSGGTDSHMFLVDISSTGLSGKEIANALDLIGITLNKNSIPFDTRSPFETSGLRIGTPACTTRGFTEDDFNIVANIINTTIKTKLDQSFGDDFVRKMKSEVKNLTSKYPIYQD
jgi:glycine hydroxymethyltransferase